MAERRRFRLPEMNETPTDYQHTSDEFIIPAVDENNESVRCQFRCPQLLHGWMGDIVASRKFPFVRDGDLMRYGLYLACATLSRIDQTVPSLQAQIDAGAAEVRRRANASMVIDHLDRVGETIADLQRKKAWGEIVYILAGERRNADTAALSEPYWGQRWLDGLKERFSDTESVALSKLDTAQLLPKMSFDTGDLQK